jgi:hypothetical protein
MKKAQEACQGEDGGQQDEDFASRHGRDDRILDQAARNIADAEAAAINNRNSTPRSERRAEFAHRSLQRTGLEVWFEKIAATCKPASQSGK